jgi:hypothetical protein
VRDDIENVLGQKIANWYNEKWIYIATPKSPFDMKMDMCIKNCAEKLRIDWHSDPSLQAPDDFVFDDLFRLLLGTVDIPLSAETTAMMTPDYIVLTGRNDVKEMLQHDEERIEILKQIANICDNRADQSEKVCDSIEEYSIPELKRQLETLQKTRADYEIFSGLSLAFDHRETQRINGKPKNAMLQIGDMQTLLCRMKQMC